MSATSTEFKPKKSVALSGVAAGSTALCTVGNTGNDLYYRGYDILEFGATPLFTTEELASVGIAMVLYPLSAFRAMNKAALNVYQELKDKGTQEGLVNSSEWL